MVLSKDKDPKLYYSIREVAEMIGVNESTLRYWETEFPQLKPRTVSTTKVRQYTEKDIEQIRVIYNLIKVRGFKIAAARKYIKENGKGADRNSDIIERLTTVRDELKHMRKMLDMLE